MFAVFKATSKLRRAQLGANAQKVRAREFLLPTGACKSARTLAISDDSRSGNTREPLLALRTRAAQAPAPRAAD